MRQLLACGALCLTMLAVGAVRADAAADDGWIELFNGKSLDGWKVGDNASSFKVEDGAIVVNGPRAHLFYDGPVQNHDFRNFEVKAEIMTFPKANSGFYIHTKYQETGWPDVGYEVQVNNSHKDPVRTGSLYNVVKVFEPASPDNQWFTMYVKVEGQRILVKVGDKTLVDYTEKPEDIKGNRKLSSGTFALQAHDPVSKVLYRSVKVRPLP